MSFISDCGVFGYVYPLVALIGIVVTVTVGRKRSNPAGVATAFAVALLAFGAIGYGVGMRQTESAVLAAQQEARVRMVTIGSREASGNLLLAGASGLLLIAVGGGASLMKKPE